MTKAAKPSADKPVWPYANVVRMTADMARNQWVKRINGKLCSFGVLDDPKAALERYRREGPALHAGLEPDAIDHQDDYRLDEVCGLFMESKAAAAELGQITRKTLRDYEATVARLLGFFGPRRGVRSLTPADWERLLRKMPFGPTRRSNFVTQVKMIFAWAHDSQITDFLPHFGRGFRGATAKDRRELAHRVGKSLFTAEQVRLILALAPPGGAMRAMVLLAINAGLGNTDIATIPRSAVDVASRVVSFPRPKTQVDRRFLLWPETASAIASWLEARPTGAGQAKDLLFVTRFGRPWVQGRTDAITMTFRRLLAQGGIIQFKERTQKRIDKGPPLGFYTLRRTFRTVADEVGDQHAIHLVMGHTLPGMSGVYVQRIGDDRLAKVVNHVRSWVFGASSQ